MHDENAETVLGIKNDGSLTFEVDLSDGTKVITEFDRETSYEIGRKLVRAHTEAELEAKAFVRSVEAIVR